MLNWGLGHATRSIPIIEELLALETKVILASSGLSLTFLENHFPQLESKKLPDIEVSYSRQGAMQAIIERSIRQQSLNEKQREFISHLVKEKRITHIISDNVYGASIEAIPSVLISHQLSLTDSPALQIVNKQLAKWINRFSEVWVPDCPDIKISGRMSQNKAVSIPIRFIGILSRFRESEILDKKYEIGILLGGPEPQRTVLEEKLVSSLKNIPGKKLLVRATEKESHLGYGKDWTVYDLLDGKTLETELSQSTHVIARSGYSSISDLVALNKCATLIATPGQPEQNYLASRMVELGFFSSIRQREISSSKVIEINETAPDLGNITRFDKNCIRDFLREH